VGVEDVHAGQAVIAHKGEWVQYSTPGAEGAEYVEGGAGTCERCFIAISTGVSPLKGTPPVSSS